MDKITEILKEMHEMADEPVRMQEGGTVLTPEEYQSRYVDFYAPFTIDVQQAPDPEDEDEDQEPVRPDILTPVGQRGEQVANVFGQIPLYGTGQQFGTEDYNSYIENFDKQQKGDLSGKGFDRYFEQAAGAPGAVASIATGLPISALAYGAGQLARKEHRKNAAAIQEYGGNAGDMFKFNGQTVSRAPGSRFFTGNLSGLSQEDLYRSREIAKGFIPGTMVENMSIRRGAGPQGMPGTSGLGGVTSIEGAMMDAFGTVHTGQRNESGHMMATATQAQRLREQEFRDAAREANIDISGLKGADFVNAAVSFKQHVDGVMKTDPSYGGFFHKTSNLSQAANNSALDRRRSTAIDFLRDKYGITTVADTADQPDEVIVPDVVATEGDDSTPPPQPSGDGGGGPQDPPAGAQSGFGGGSRSSARDDAASDRAGSPRGGRGGGRSSSSSSRGQTRSSYDSFSGFHSGRAMGGRIGMQAGGTAQRPLPEAGFVAGPPENFTERETVADDQNGSVAEGTFVINAAAVEFAGSDDIRKMILDAYSTAREKGLDIGRVDRKLYEGTVDVALSKGEVVVPPELAKIIGYDRLEKINNRGKKEVSRRQEKAGGGFLDGKKFAKGGEAPKTLPKRKPRKGQLADVELRADLEEFIKDDQLARLGWDLYTSGDLKLVGLPVQRGVRAYSAAGIYLPAEGRDTFPVFPSGLGYSAEQESQREKVGGPASLQGTFVEPLFKGVGKVLDPKAPTAMYFAEPFKIHPEDRTTDAPKNDRAQVMITLAHELRHAALNHLVFDYGAPQMTLGGEEALMDHFDEKARRTASKKNALVSAVALTKGRKSRQEAARYSSHNKRQYELYNKLATEVLKERGVPPSAKPEEKGFIERALDKLFN